MALRKLPAVGATAPPFTLPDAKRRPHSLASHAGRRVVVYFYPKDDTPGCTTEACDFRDNMARLLARNVDVIGISPDGGSSHAKFAKKHQLPFPLLSDPERKALSAYGAWGEKMERGWPAVGVLRSTFLIGADGKVLHVWPDVKAAGHVDAILKWLEMDARLHAVADKAVDLVSRTSAGAKVAGRKAAKAIMDAEQRAEKAAAPAVERARKAAAPLVAQARKAVAQATRSAKRTVKSAKTSLKSAERAVKAGVKAGVKAAKASTQKSTASRKAAPRKKA